MIVLDTDVLTLVQRANSAEYDRRRRRLESVPDEPVCVTIISFEEQMRGWLAWIARARALDRQQEAYLRLDALLEDYQSRPVLDFDNPAIAEFRRLSKLRTHCGTMDLKSLRRARSLS